MISCVPTPAVAGSKVPADVFVIPVPLQVPPAVAAVSVAALSLMQNGPAGVIVASSIADTTMFIVSVSGQAPEVVYVISCVPTPAVAGSKVPFAVFVMPVPAQVPPAFTAVRFVAGSLVQKGPAAFMAASVMELTVTVTVALFVQPLLVPVTEYVVVEAGAAENEVPVPVGLHE